MYIIVYDQRTPIPSKVQQKQRQMTSIAYWVGYVQIVTWL